MLDRNYFYDFIKMYKGRFIHEDMRDEYPITLYSLLDKNNNIYKLDIFYDYLFRLPEDETTCDDIIECNSKSHFKLFNNSVTTINYYFDTTIVMCVGTLSITNFHKFTIKNLLKKLENLKRDISNPPGSEPITYYYFDPMQLNLTEELLTKYYSNLFKQP